MRGEQPLGEFGRLPLKANIGVIARLIGRVRVVTDDAPLPIADLFVERTCVLSFVNSHAVNLACANPEFLELLLGADLLLRDGVGMSLLYRWIGKNSGRNMNGTDYIPVLLAAGGQVPVGIYGSTREVADMAAHRLRGAGVNVVSCRDGFLRSAEYANAVQVDHPRVVVLGMGMPKQEIVAQYLRDVITTPVLIINGGAILDFLADRFRRAPLFVRRLRLEWLFRLLLEPRRLWRRYIVGNAVFLARAAAFAIKLRLGIRSKP